MSNLRFTFVDAAAAQRHIRVAMSRGGLSVAQSLEIAEEVWNRFVEREREKQNGGSVPTTNKKAGTRA